MRKPPKPLDKQRLEELALAYVARFATSKAKLERYLARKLRERGWDDESEPDINALSEKYEEFGYLDDEQFARSRSNGLLKRGYGPRRVDQALGEAGIAVEMRENLRPNVRQIRQSALKMAQKRRFGPYGGGILERSQREKQLAAMARAGHAFEDAVRVVDAESEREAEEWAAEADDENGI